MIIFFVCLLKIENIRAQCERPSVQGNRQLKSDSYQSSYPDGSTAEFECSVGYLPVNSRASKIITCNGKTWTDLELQCKKKSCGALPDFLNGRYTFSPEGDDSILYGAQATPECDKGYVLTGIPRICNVDGWRGREPVCEEVKCLPPPDPEHGKPTEPLEEIYRYQTVITYSCNEGYVLSGSDSISCLENGKFQTPPQCSKLSCDETEFDPKSSKTGAKPPYKLGSLVSFYCSPGYILDGDRELKCEPSGWSSRPPQCIDRVIPPSPTSPPPHNNGMKIGLAVGIPLVILALCVGGYLYKKQSSARGYSGNVAKNEDGQL